MFILTFDYELFGSGKGCVFKHIIRPTYKILECLDSYGIKATFFIEQLEIDALIGLKEKFPNSSYEYKAAVAIEKQLEFMVRNGHDLQLHLHPQWHNAKYESGKWHLDFDWWRFSALPNSDQDKVNSKYTLIKRGKNSLEKRFRAFDPTYQCVAFRAGGYNFGQSKQAIDALVDNGIVIESSVCPGFSTATALSHFDYSNAPNDKYYWYIKDNVTKPVNYSRCIELPLLTINSGFLERISLPRIYTFLFFGKYKKVKNTISPPEPNVVNKSTANSNFDVCLSSQRQVSRFMQVLKSKNSSPGDLRPVLLIGHPKDYSVFSPMTSIIQQLVKDGDFITIADFVKEVKN